ncbi:hypothetical protein QQG09_01305 [Melissococcus plutonius]|uniref:Uncharacterized protein n=2 Tax=Melissococcus plutonius TaxID=33970 RepID=F3Y9E1_MELPT|nr:hypothetical protein [Melissococcus plutonius]BAL62492.1 hypothetical protein MPD5_1276 [Melissococcus plutonius DAT561]AIM24679.1 hypothetical protein MEPL_c005690 [Melissococcus plutonius S1]KMT24781.1 hypothetical protein MEPL2_2c03160 [Melissococcus plutonius]KMT26418.1 hypothetical protein MEPL3_2c00790 [Melissococcus plutonius]KMT27668.1 hypothetical protein MEPL1_3c03090 [Melissococcus plutonius]
MDKNTSIEEKIAALKNGDIQEIIVTPDTFLAFREVWKNLPDKKNIVGEASLNGTIIYRYNKNTN